MSKALGLLCCTAGILGIVGLGVMSGPPAATAGQGINSETTAIGGHVTPLKQDRPRRGRDRDRDRADRPDRPGGDYFPPDLRPLVCDRGQEYMQVTHGVMDNFGLTGPAELPTPSADLITSLGTNDPGTNNRYDHDMPDTFFADTFNLGIPASTKAVHLRITGRFRQAHERFETSTDSIGFQQVQSGGAAGFNRFAYSQTPTSTPMVAVWNVDGTTILPTPNTTTPTPNGQNVLDGITNNGTLDVVVQDDTSVDYITVELCTEPVDPERGLTWHLRSVEPTTGTVVVGCHGGTPDCDPYNGDTVCTAALPILCINDLDAQKPASVIEPDRYVRWSGGIVHTTAPVVGSSLATLADANAVCVQEFGPGWRVAEHHDGWGWNFSAYGNVGDPNSRFWVDINDQANGTCWDR